MTAKGPDLGAFETAFTQALAREQAEDQRKRAGRLDAEKAKRASAKAALEHELRAPLVTSKVPE